VYRGQHVLAMALTIPLCVLVAGVIVVVVMLLRRQVARVQQKKLQLKARIEGVKVECEVWSGRLLYVVTDGRSRDSRVLTFWSSTRLGLLSPMPRQFQDSVSCFVSSVRQANSKVAYLKSDCKL